VGTMGPPNAKTHLRKSAGRSCELRAPRLTVNNLRSLRAAKAKDCHVFGEIYITVLRHCTQHRGAQQFLRSPSLRRNICVDLPFLVDSGSNRCCALRDHRTAKRIGYNCSGRGVGGHITTGIVTDGRDGTLCRKSVRHVYTCTVQATGGKQQYAKSTASNHVHRCRGKPVFI
jgi:hypothetical protein